MSMVRERSHSPSALACGSKRVDEATPSPSSPSMTKFSARRLGRSASRENTRPRLAARKASGVTASVDSLSSAYRRFYSTNGASAAKQAVSRASHTVNTICPGAAS